MPSSNMHPQLSKTEFSIAVIYLSWIPYGIGLFKDFFTSYQQFNAGYKHKLVVVFNGLKSENDIKEYLEYLNEINIQPEIFQMEKGQDIDAYFFAAKQCGEEFIFLANSFSKFNVDNWLRFYVSAFEQNKKTIVSATASLQSHYSLVFIKHRLGWEFEKNFLYNYGKYKLFIKALFYWRLLFKPFPNPHLRTNALMLNRNAFLSFYKGQLISKFKAYLFESGRKGLTMHFIKEGYEILVIDKFGNTYEIKEWHKSNTFWNGEQENLMISDNQTELYNESSWHEKKYLRKIAWGLNE